MDGSPYCFLERRRERQRLCAIGAQDHGHFGKRFGRPQDLWAGRGLGVELVKVCRHSNDRLPGSWRSIRREPTNMATNGVLVRPELSGKRFIDNDHVSRIRLSILVCEEAP